MHVPHVIGIILLVAHANGDWDDFGAQLSASLHKLTDLENLGPNIEENVYNSLKPVRILETKAKIKSGIDGNTTVQFLPQGKTFVITDGTFYECSTTISNGQCSGKLVSYPFSQKQDFCYASNKNQVNNIYCISTGPLVTQYWNGNLQCSSPTNKAVLQISVKDYNNMCGNIAKSASYTYYTSNIIKEFGHGLECEGNNPQICKFQEDLISSNVFSNVVITY